MRHAQKRDFPSSRNHGAGYANTDDGKTSHSTEPSSSGTSELHMNGPDVHERAAMRSGGGSSYIPDEEVHVNLAMADLMAYLQVVANNSQNLPLTRRDDPELGRTVSTLTADEYARKSAAFIPSDVRIIGGSFIKYGRVWDLPTSEVRQFGNSILLRGGLLYLCSKSCCGNNSI